MKYEDDIYLKFILKSSLNGDGENTFPDDDEIIFFKVKLSENPYDLDTDALTRIEVVPDEGDKKYTLKSDFEETIRKITIDYVKQESITEDRDVVNQRKVIYKKFIDGYNNLFLNTGIIFEKENEGGKEIIVDYITPLIIIYIKEIIKFRHVLAEIFKWNVDCILKPMADNISDILEGIIQAETKSIFDSIKSTINITTAFIFNIINYTIKAIRLGWYGAQQAASGAISAGRWISNLDGDQKFMLAGGTLGAAAGYYSGYGAKGIAVGAIGGAAAGKGAYSLYNAYNPFSPLKSFLGTSGGSISKTNKSKRKSLRKSKRKSKHQKKTHKKNKKNKKTRKSIKKR